MGNFELPIIGGTPINSKLSITINSTVIRDYIDNYSVEIQEEYDTENQFEAIDGTKYDMYKGSRRVLSINFNSMSSSQIQELFNAIKSKTDETTNRPIQEISYIDPKDGATTKTFYCSNLPSATYFESESDIYWKIPTVTFTEFNLDKTGGEGGEVYTIYKYKIEIGSMQFTEKEISKDISISMSVSANGFDVGQIASCSISGSVICKFNAIIHRNDKVKAYVKSVSVHEYNDEQGIHHRDETSLTDWQLINVWFLKTAEKTNANILTFSAMDCIAFLDNNYYINYERDAETGEIIPQTTTGHLAAIAEMVGTLANNLDNSIPFPRYCDDLQISPQNSNNARTFIQNAAASGATNYRQGLSPLNEDNLIIEAFQFGAEIYSINENECEEFSIGFMGENIDTIILYCGSVNELPNNIFPEMYKYYNIYIIGSVPTGQYPKQATTLEINAQLAPFSAAAEENNFQQLIGKNFGTEFSVNKVKMRRFINVGLRIKLPNISESYYLYATSINYSLTETGVFASISGSARDLSDSHYLGGMEKDMEQRIKIDENYNNVMVSKEGLFLIAPKEDGGNSGNGN